MKTIIILGFIISLIGCHDYPPQKLECSKIKILGSCVDSFINPHCVAELENGMIINVVAPTMVGRKVCRRGKGYWFYQRE